MAQKYYSPLRYPGGKGKLLNFVKDLIIHNNLTSKSYSEPYAGGAGVAIGLLLDDFVSEIHINDIDYGIFSFWQAVLESTDEFLKKLWETPVNLEQWNCQVYIQRNQNEFSPLEVGFSTFFLNRTNRSGIINAGVIGGLNQEGKYKIDARFNKDSLARRIKNIACHKNQIKVYNYDAMRFIEQEYKKIPDGLIFLDPPYYDKGKLLYTNHYSHQDHVKVARAVRLNLKKWWIVTYDSSDEINSIYQGENKITYDLRYSLTKTNTKGSEFLFYSPKIELPYHPNYKTQKII